MCERECVYIEPLMCASVLVELLTEESPDMNGQVDHLKERFSVLMKASA